MNSLGLTDGYKLTHHMQYPKGTTKVVTNGTPRSDNYAFPQAKGHVVVFGAQFAFKTIQEHFAKNFFMSKEREEGYFADKPRRLKALKDSIIGELKEEYSLYTGMDYDVSHFEALWDLGYLPIEVRSLDEGTLSPMRVPIFTVHNTIDEFYWITNYLETLISNLVWKPMTSATIARAYKQLIKGWVQKTDPDNIAGIDFQGHDFSMRGMDAIDAAVSSGLGHLTAFSGGDTLPAIFGARKYYNEPKGTFVMGGVPATEHSVMCAGTKDDEIQTFRNLMNTFPNGFLSVVSDTWDLWKVLTVYLPELKEQILGRDGKLVIRPDSGDPVDILCGAPYAEHTTDELKEIADDIREYHLEDIKREGHIEYIIGINTFIVTEDSIEYHPKHKGVIELLWDVFGGTTNDQGFKVLDSHIGAIYGDSITLKRAENICQRLADKGFASSNVVFGIGSFTYQYNTRDTYGFAMKATYVELKEIDQKATEKAEREMQSLGAPNGHAMEYKIIGREIFKDPITDDGIKKSAKGLVFVSKDENGEYVLEDQVSWERFTSEENELKPIFRDGKFLRETTLTEVRNRLNL